MVKFRVTPRAREDLINIGRYTEQQWGKSQRNTYLKKIEQRFTWLASNPNIGKPRPEISEDFMSYPEGLHVVFYLINKENIDIIGVPHKQMDVLNYFSESLD
jgi:toxin ParE1/3/4